MPFADDKVFEWCAEAGGGGARLAFGLADDATFVLFTTTVTPL
jgi:hypothetical protein